ncbi:3-hydroxyacyl-CoA dehydrogenase family protein [Streptomyces sp. A012304]|uniref:3-hydroxyacyl-CoA dehydrogenase family protein n=1 Tax=Streptomyces sp. A012304 TaxID=375446 RepID=UPI00222FE46C|nr:3-hydroxyacyl-CoA dehydrogenase family protein [Streptomyces sp. A012304]
MAENQVPYRLVVLGAGVMGAGITALAVGHGVSVTLVDVDEDKAGRAREQIEDQLRMARLMNALPAGRDPGDLTVTTTPEAAAGAGVVIEAVTELLDAKVKALAQVSATVSPGTALVSNTSSIPIDELADAVDRPEDLVGAHFMNPPYLIPMVEVARGPRTADRTMDAVTSLLTALGRQPVVVGDGPGFVTSRILHRMINDAVRVVEEGRATPEAVDTLMRGCLGHRTGPLRTADLIGLDNLADSLRVLYERTGDEGCRPCTLLLDKVAQGDLGRKSGRGFYDYGEAMP